MFSNQGELHCTITVSTTHLVIFTVVGTVELLVDGVGQVIIVASFLHRGTSATFLNLREPESLRKAHSDAAVQVGVWCMYLEGSHLVCSLKAC